MQGGDGGFACMCTRIRSGIRLSFWKASLNNLGLGGKTWPCYEGPKVWLGDVSKAWNLPMALSREK